MTRPILVTGFQRSGTSILGEILSQHPQVRYQFEPFHTGPASMQPDRFKDVDGFVHVLKDPRLLIHAKVAVQRWPTARWVLIQRDARDVACSVASAMKMGHVSRAAWLRSRQVPKQVENMVADLSLHGMALVVQAHYRHSRPLPDAVVVRYEELLTDTEWTVDKLLADLGLVPSIAVDKFLPNVDTDVAVHMSHGSGALFERNHTRRIGRWHDELTEEDRDLARLLGVEGW